MLRRWPWLLSFALFAMAVAIARPFGEFPVNDDWQYARTAKHFAETGRFVIDTEVAPSLFGQSLLALPLIKVFGFSHLSLRVLTMALGLLALWLVDLLLEAAGATLTARLVAGASLALNPWAFYLNTTFMTETYGLVPMLLAAVLWFRRARTVGLAVLVGALCAYGFWTRQYAAVALPALALPAIARGRREGRPWKDLWREVCPMLLTGAILIAAWFPWVRWTGNYRREFAVPFRHLARFSPQIWLVMGSVALVYVTAVLLPLLLHLAWRREEARRMAGLCVLFLACGLVARTIANWAGDTADGARSFLHTAFPYLGNVLRNAGLGPLTFPEIYIPNQPSPLRWSPAPWVAIESVILAGMALWGPLVAASRRLAGASFEVGAFGLLVAVFHFALIIQTFQLEMHDRYLYPVMVGMLLLAAVCVSTPAPRPLRFASPLVLLLLGGFSVAAVHDEFSWMAARWSLVNEAHAAGVPPENLQAGFEADGWFHYDRYAAREAPRGCIGPCHCALGGWYCQDDSYRVGMLRLSDAEPVKVVLPRTWLTEPRPVALTRRVLAPR